jgi:hypothetical protein
MVISIVPIKGSKDNKKAITKRKIIGVWSEK